MIEQDADRTGDFMRDRLVVMRPTEENSQWDQQTSEGGRFS